MNSRELYEAFSYVDDKYLTMADTLQKENETMTPKRNPISFRRLITIALAAALCVSVLGITAMAAGWIPNIFKTAQKEYPIAAEVLEEAIQVIQTQPQQPETVEIPEMDLSKLTLFERYYDGEKILLGYNLDAIIPSPVAAYEPDAALLEEIKDMAAFEHVPYPGLTDDSLAQHLELGILTQEEYRQVLDGRTEQAKKHDIRKFQNIRMDQELKEKLTPEQYNAFWKQMEEKGYGCVVTQSVYIGDHKYINQVDPDPNNIMEYVTDAGTCLHLEPLPEEGQNKESVTVDLKVKSGITYWYMEMDGYCYQLYKPNQERTISFTLENVNPS